MIFSALSVPVGSKSVFSAGSSSGSILVSTSANRDSGATAFRLNRTSISTLYFTPVLASALAALALLAPVLVHAQSVDTAEAVAGNANAPQAGKAGVRINLPEIAVQAQKERAESGGRSVRLDSDDLQRRNAVDMAGMARYESLISVPGAASGSGNIWDGAGNTGFNIRGVEGNRVSIALDGIAMPDAAAKPDANSLNSFGVGRDYFDPETLRQVRFSSGTSAGTEAVPGLAGSVALGSKSPQDFLNADKSTYFGYAANHNSSDTSLMQAVTGAARSGALQGLAMYVHRKGQQRQTYEAVLQNPDEWSSDAVLAKLQWELNPANNFELTVDSFQSDHQRRFLNKLSPAYPAGAQQDSHTERRRISLAHQLSSPDFIGFDHLQTLLYSQKARVDDLTSAQNVSRGIRSSRNIRTSYINDSLGLVLNADKRIGTQHQLSYGLNFEQIESSRPWLDDRTITASGAHQITQKNRMADVTTQQWTAKLADDFRFDLAGYSATLSPALRAQYRSMSPKNLGNYVIAVPQAAQEIKQDSAHAVTPSLGLNVTLFSGFDAYVQYAQGARLPTAADRTGTYDSFSYTGAGAGYAVLGNPALKKESSDAFELGVRGTISKGVQFNASVFNTQYRDFIEYVAQPIDTIHYPTISYGLYRPENIGKVHTWGGEMSSRFELGVWSPSLAGFSLNLAAGLARGNAENTTTGKQGELASALPAKGTLTIAYDDAAQRFGASLSTVRTNGKQAKDDVISGDTVARFAVPASTVLDLSGYWNITKNAKLILGIYNLSDQKYWDYASVRGLAADTTVLAHSEIERQSMPGRNFSARLNLNF